MYDLLSTACRVEVESRSREFHLTEAYKSRIRDVSRWLVSKESSFGLFLCGLAGNGKTTMLRAIENLTNFLRSDEPYSSSQDEFPQRGIVFVSAKEMVRFAKAFNNPTAENREEVRRYKRMLNIEVLCVDDLGQEPKDSVSYGETITAAVDVLSYRYEKRLCTLVSSNLDASQISGYYDERLADRFREMMHVVNFADDASFRA